MKLLSLFLSVVFFLPCSSWGMVVQQIEVSGLKRTNASVVLSELGFNQGDDIAPEDIEKAKKKLYNTRLFSKVEILASDGKINVSVDERWTTIPILKFASGGGVNRYTLGVFDPNIFGLFKEAGGQVEILEKSTSGVIWFRDPRFINDRLKLSLDLWNIKEVSRWQEDRGRILELEKVTQQNQHRFSAALKYKILEQLSIEGLYTYRRNVYATDLLTDEELIVSQRTSLPDANIHQKFGLGVEFGEVNYDTWSLTGSLFRMEYKFSDYNFDHLPKRSSHELNLDYVHYTPMYWDSLFASRWNIESKSNPIDNDHVFIGGLDKVRGYSNNRFYANNGAFTNLEWRKASWQSESFILQHTVFYDAGYTFDKKEQIYFDSIGSGIRLISPKIYRLVARIDFAKTLSHQDQVPISFGVQQFF